MKLFLTTRTQTHLENRKVYIRMGELHIFKYGFDYFNVYIVINPFYSGGEGELMPLGNILFTNIALISITVELKFPINKFATYAKRIVFRFRIAYDEVVSK